MFRSLKRKIIAAIMSVLIVVFAGTLALIFLVSYHDVRNESYTMMSEYSEVYQRGGKRSPEGGGNGHKNREEIYGLTTFYSAEFADKISAVHTENQNSSGLTDEELTTLAKQVLDSGKSSGSENHMLYLVTQLSHGYLVVFMNNTVTNDSFTTLFRYTFLFGCCTIILLFFFSWLVAGRMVKPLEEAFQKQKQFISDASHELKTPLSVISANADLLERSVGENQWLENIRFENVRMAELVNQLLQLARVEGSRPVHREFDLSRTVTGVTLPFESVAYERSVILETVIADGIKAFGDAEQVGQVAAILVDNAIEHTEVGGTVKMELRQKGGLAVIRVSNTGREIPADQREKIFERFYRLDEARTGDSNHYGLGLSIAKAIVAEHKGKIAVDCAGGITTFTVSLAAANH